MLRMMRLLVLDIFQFFLYNRLAHRKCTVTTLPSKPLIMGAYRFYPSTAISLHFFDNMGNVLVLGQQEEDVDMVSCSTCLYHTATRGVDQLSYVFMHAFQILLAKKRTGSPDMEYQMDIYSLTSTSNTLAICRSISNEG